MDLVEIGGRNVLSRAGKASVKALTEGSETQPANLGKFRRA
jgi:hypothetical protein